MRKRMASRVAIAVLVMCSTLVFCNAGGGLRAAHHAHPAIPKYTIFNVMNFGAKPGKQQESTEAFAKAWRAACDFNGNARLVIPPGVYKLSEMIFEGPCKSQSSITIYLQGTLQAVSDLSAYPDKGWIQLDSINGLILTGGGTIDGQGQNVWQYNDCKSNPTCTHLAASVYMTKVTNAKIKSIKLMNSMGFHMHITRSNLIRLHSLNINSPEDGPNTDGIHISQSNTVKVSRSIIRTGDDCISIGQGSTNVTINQLTCGPGHGISVGSLGKLQEEKDVQGLIVNNCTLIGTANGLRIKTFAASQPSRASGILFKNIIMYDVKNPIVINQNYGSRATKPSLVKISDVVYQNIRGTTISPVPVNLMCSPKAPCQNVHLHNINLKFSGNELPVTSSCENAKVGYSGVQYPPPC